MDIDGEIRTPLGALEAPTVTVDGEDAGPVPASLIADTLNATVPELAGSAPENDVEILTPSFSAVQGPPDTEYSIR